MRVDPVPGYLSAVAGAVVANNNRLVLGAIGCLVLTGLFGFTCIEAQLPSSDARQAGETPRDDDGRRELVIHDQEVRIRVDANRPSGLLDGTNGVADHLPVHASQ